MNAIAVVSRTGSSSEISYDMAANPVMENMIIMNAIDPLDSMIRVFKMNNLNKVINVFHCYRFYDDLLGKLRDNSYSLIDISRFYFDYSTNTLEINFTGGTIDSIEVRGNYVTNENVITREIAVNKDNPVRKRDIDNSIKNVISTNLFQQVSFDYDYSKDLFLPDLKIRLVEKNTMALRFSLRVDNERKLQLLLDLRSENIFGTAIETGLLVAGGVRNQIYQFDVQSSQFFSLPLTFNYNTYYGFRDIYRYVQVIDSIENKYNVFNVGDYSNVRYGMSFLLGTQLQRYGTMYGQIFYENQQIQNIVNSGNLVQDLNIIKLKFGGTFDTEDKIPFPNSGVLLNFYYETATNTLQGDQSFTKLYLSYDQYFTIAKSQIIRPRFIFGFGDKTTPLTEQFSLGGEKSFYGMVDDELRGRQILEASLEYRYLFPYKLFFDTYFSIRYDLGNVWQVTEDIRFKDLRHGVGLSTSFDTPVGQASFSVGKSFLIKKGLTEDSFIFGPYDFYFSIGYDI
jgi:outer membrane protein assembly factor BamA